jgi:hypothetical protein
MPPPPWNQRGGGQHSLASDGAGRANSDDWRQSLALCILCAPDAPSSGCAHAQMHMHVLVAALSQETYSKTLIPILMLAYPLRMCTFGHAAYMHLPCSRQKSSQAALPICTPACPMCTLTTSLCNKVIIQHSNILTRRILRTKSKRTLSLARSV